MRVGAWLRVHGPGLSPVLLTARRGGRLIGVALIPRRRVWRHRIFPVRQLPAGLRRLAPLSPLWHGVELCRAATTGHVRAGSAAGHVLVLLGFVAAGAWWGTRTFSRRLAQ